MTIDDMFNEIITTARKNLRKEDFLGMERALIQLENEVKTSSISKEKKERFNLISDDMYMDATNANYQSMVDFADKGDPEMVDAYFKFASRYAAKLNRHYEDRVVDAVYKKAIYNLLENTCERACKGEYVVADSAVAIAQKYALRRGFEISERLAEFRKSIQERSIKVKLENHLEVTYSIAVKLEDRLCNADKIEA